MKNEENELVTIDPKQCKRMLVWDYHVENAEERIVVAKAGKSYIAISVDHEEEFLNSGHFTVVAWENAEPIPTPKKVTMKEVCEKFGYDVEIRKEEG